MATENIIAPLETLITLHKLLYSQALVKTEVIKKGDLHSLQPIIAEERNCIKLINQTQAQLMKQVQAVVDGERNAGGQAVLRDCIDYLPAHDRVLVTDLQTQLAQSVLALQTQNDLNQQLLEQSLAFVHMSIDLLKPDMEMFNYERPNRSRPYEQEGRSFFDSNA